MVGITKLMCVLRILVQIQKKRKELIESKDLYHVVVNPGMDQAFVFGVIAVLDYIYGESTHR